MFEINELIFNTRTSGLKTAVYGEYTGNAEAFKVDANGELILSPSIILNATANGLDIRPLSLLTDSAFITASNLDIRNLSGTQDTLQIFKKTFAEDTASGSIPAFGTSFFLTKDVSNFKNNTYIVRNTSLSVAVTVTLQIAPIDSPNFYVDDGSSFSLLASSVTLFRPTRLMKYARIMVSALLLGNVTVYYFGQS